MSEASNYLLNYFRFLNRDEISTLGSQLNMIEPMTYSKLVSEKGISYGLDSCSYDISIRETSLSRFEGNALDITDERTSGRFVVRSMDPKTDSIEIFPKEMYLATSVEKFNIPDDVIGLAFLKATWTRTGLMMSPALLHPGWSGHLVLALINPTSHGIVLYGKEGLASVMFSKIGISHANYETYSNKYQGQDGP